MRSGLEVMSQRERRERGWDEQKAMYRGEVREREREREV